MHDIERQRDAAILLGERHASTAIKLMAAIDRALMLLQSGRIDQARELLVKKLEEAK